MRTPVTQSEIVVGLDLGTTKVSAVVGEVDADGITILGVGNVPYFSAAAAACPGS